MKKRIYPFLLLATMVCLASSCQSDLDRRAAAFEKAEAAFLDSIRNAGLEVVLVENNAIVYNHCFGYKNVQSRTPLTPDCLFRIASISKSFTTTALLQQVEKGCVSLDTDVSELAGFPIRNPHYPDTVITLEMLLSHTSSINDSEGYFTLDAINPNVNPDYAKAYNDYCPGCGYEYCNLNLNLAGSFLEKITGERFHEYIVGHILRPLGLYGGYMVDSLDASRFASLYQLSEDGSGEYVCTDAEAYEPRTERFRDYRMGYDTPLFSPTGGMKISAPDLARYMMMHMNYGISPEGVRILPEALAREMQRPRSADENYGLTLWTTDRYSPGDTLVGHTGDAYGMRSAMFFSPEKKFGFVVISTGSYEPMDPANIDPTGSDAADHNVLTRTLTLMYDHFIR